VKKQPEKGRNSRPTRPERTSLVNELGQKRTLPGGAGQYVVSGPEGGSVVVLGLGPDPGELAELLRDLMADAPSGGRVLYLECPEFAGQMPAAWADSIPASWRALAPADMTGAEGVPDMSRARVVVYRPARSLFPSFWGPILAVLQLRRMGRASELPGPEPGVGEVWLPTDESELLHREMRSAFEQAGLAPVELDIHDASSQVARRLAHARPELFFSLNFHGLDPQGELYHLLRAAGVPVVVWCVDNPFHLLSGVKSPYWKNLHLFVTDDWFIPRLRSMGACNVHHLPLAAWTGLADGLVSPASSDQVTFVGSSAFPDKRKFFSGLRLPRELTAQAASLLERGRCADRPWPDYGWWLENLPQASLWPGKASRLPGLGAEQCSQAWRVGCVRELGRRLPLRVYGDAGWQDIVPDLVDLRTPVDYYTELPGIYAASRANLNMTSLLLPHGLTQRHFDVWICGGLLLTDATPGLDVFPEELVREVCFSRPEEIPALLERIEAGAGLCGALIGQWRDELLRAHTYVHRMETVLARVGCGL
jgi:hypothetical protein